MVRAWGMTYQRLHLRVANTYLETFAGRSNGLLALGQDVKPDDIAAFRDWLGASYNLSGRLGKDAPKSAKATQQQLLRLWGLLDGKTVPYQSLISGGFITTMLSDLLPRAAEIDQHLRRRSDTGISVVQDGVTYENKVGAGEQRFLGMVREVGQVLRELDGWRQRALSGGLRVILAGPGDFGGTASGKYSLEMDALLVRATPNGRISRGGDRYGGLAYVITHELGHRYEAKFHTPNFETNAWRTSKYSEKEGEAFAELFALSNFGITSDGRKTWSPELLDAFREIMGG